LSMRRYLLNRSISDLPILQYDVCIIGSGIAGLYAGLHISPDKKCLIVTKTNIEQTNSYLAQGGIAAVIASDDKFESHVEDTLKAGAGLCDPEAVRVLVKEGPENIRELIDLNVPFDVNPEGELQITREGGHTHRRIVHCGGDATGRETTKRLGEIARTRENLDISFDTYLVDLLTEENRIVGAIIFDTEPKIVLSPNVILCTGGIGALYTYTTNPRGAVGEGIAAAMRAGAVVEKMEMIQFHPTTFFSAEQEKKQNLFLISEAVRGEGGILRDQNGNAFMQGQHEMADLAPRDIVTRAILRQLNKSGETNVFLDVSSMSEDFFSHRFPTIFKECRESGIRVPFEAIPVRPAQHYLMGGIKTDLDGMTNIEGLYACGECACTGIHGANRLASNSMLECLVFGRRAARHINAASRKGIDSVETLSLPLSDETALPESLCIQAEDEVRKVMTAKLNAVRSEAGMAQAEEEIAALAAKIEPYSLNTKRDYELYSMITVAQKVIADARNRKESVGAHFVGELS